jgi:hypothetical protein
MCAGFSANRCPIQSRSSSLSAARSPRSLCKLMLMNKRDCQLPSLNSTTMQVQVVQERHGLQGYPGQNHGLFPSPVIINMKNIKTKIIITGIILFESPVDYK